MCADGEICLTPIGRVVGGRSEPRDDRWGAENAVVRLDRRQYSADALRGLEDFSHVEVVYHFHLVADDAVERVARRPRNNPAWPRIGVFAQRGKKRPNRLGVSVCEIVSVDGLEVTVRGLDAVDGTPVLDLKPYMREFGPRGTLRQPSWVGELMADYW